MTEQTDMEWKSSFLSQPVLTDDQDHSVSNQENETFYNSIIENISDSIIVLDFEAKFLYMNQGAMKALAIFDFAKIKGTSWLNYWDIKDKIAATKAFENAKHGKSSKFTGYQKLKWWSIALSPMINAKGEIWKILVVSRDITEQKEIETKLTFERNQLEAIFQQSPAAMVLWTGPDFVFEKVNPHYQAIFPDRVLKDKAFLDACPEFKDQPFQDLLTNVLKTGEPFIGRAVLARHSNYVGGPINDHYYDFTYMQVKDGDGKPYGVYDHAIDVTERVLDKMALEENKSKLLSTINELEQERALRERFVATLAHDLRTPLTAAQMSTQIMQRNPDTAQANRKMAHRISDALERMENMITNLLDANLISAGGMLPIKIENCFLNKFVSDTIDDLKTVHGDRFIFQSNLEIHGFWSKSGIRRILENLCINAVKYGANHRPITVLLDRNEDTIQLKVHNEGSFIAPEDRKKLFEPFNRLDALENSRQLGWGLGLTLVKGIAEAHGGNVSVESSLDDGTIFCVNLPMTLVKTEN